jgi:hypothetical protein
MQPRVVVLRTERKTTREPAAGAWRTRGSYLRTGPLREQDFSLSFLHNLQKTGILVPSQKRFLDYFLPYCENEKNCPYVNNLKNIHFVVSYSFLDFACTITMFVFIYLMF